MDKLMAFLKINIDIMKERLSLKFQSATPVLFNYATTVYNVRAVEFTDEISH